jgi:hypothetical protein
MKHLLVNKLLSEEQHGFMKGKSCTTNLLEYVDILTEALFKGKVYDVLYTDFKKAFDSVSHIKLISKVSALRIKGSLLEWIKIFLLNRKQRVVMGESITAGLM